MSTGKGFRRVFFIPDTHVPFHDKRAFELALKIGAQLKPDATVILGDFADFYAVSQHDKSPDRKVTLLSEATAVKECLREINQRVPSKRRIYLAGNHEYRLDRYIKKQAPEFYGITSVDKVLELDALGWEYVPYHGYAKIGKLLCTHDTGSAGMNAHRKSLSDAGGGLSVVIGHTHRMSTETKTALEGDFISASMFGWLGDPDQIDYMHKTKTLAWTHGVGLVYLLPDGVAIPHPIPFHNYQAFVEGSLISLG